MWNHSTQNDRADHRLISSFQWTSGFDCILSFVISAGKARFPFFATIESFHKESRVLMFSEASWGNSPGGYRTHLWRGPGKKQTSSFHLDFEIGVLMRVVVYPNSTSRLESWWEAMCRLINTVNSMTLTQIRTIPNHFKDKQHEHFFEWVTRCVGRKYALEYLKNDLPEF